MAEPIQVACSNCFATLKLKDSRAIGKKVRCPKCSEPFVVEPMDDPEDDFLGDLDLGDGDYGGEALPREHVRKVKRKKKRESPVGSEATPESLSEAAAESSGLGLGVMMWIVGGLAGGAIGVAIWVGVGYATQGAEVGWIAWGVGGLVGLGVRMASDGHEGFFPALIAATISIISILLGKYLVVVLLVNMFAAKIMGGDIPEGLEVNSDPMMISRLAHEVVAEYEEKGTEITMPDPEIVEIMGDDPSVHFPPGIWAEATKRWNAMSPDEQEAAKVEVKEELEKNIEEFGDEITVFAFLGSFGLFDLLWFFLATGSAFRVAMSDFD